MPLAALTPVLNDLLHKVGTSPSASPHNQSLQQIPNSNDSPSSSEQRRKGSITGQSTNVTNPLSSSSIVNVSI
jgi:hypothetical protein